MAPQWHKGSSALPTKGGENFYEQSFSEEEIFFREKILRENSGRKFRDRYPWSVVRIVSIHSSFTYYVD